jgi:hypothetical protein
VAAAPHSDKGGRTLETSREWYEALADVFGLPMADATPKDRDKLWQRVRHAHDAWLAGRT